MKSDRSQHLPYVVIVILNWNGKTDTLECLESVRQLDYPNFKVVVVDNGSTDDSVEAISKQYPEVQILQTGSNLGYAGGNNFGIKWALEHGAEFLLILNNDTTIAPNLLSVFVSSLNTLPTGSIMGAKIYFYDKPNTLWFAGGRWHKQTSHFEHIGYNQIDGPDFNSIVQVDYITGCALLSSAETFKNVGFLDESFFLTYEETDWCYRAKAKGHKCFVIPNAKIWHKISVSFGGSNSPIYTYFMRRNKLLWAKKYLSCTDRAKLQKKSINTIRRIFFPPLFFMEPSLPLAKRLLWSFSSWMKTIKRNIENPINRATLFGLRDYYLGRFGNCPDAVRLLGKANSHSKSSDTP